ncbi:MAG: AAA family ATPase [Anaerolineae bacterium]
MINVLVIADATPMRADIVDSIEQDSDLALVGTTASPSQALAAIRDADPDIILIDQNLNNMSTLSLTEDLVARYPDLTVIAIAGEGHMNYVRHAMLAGARGFVTVPMAKGELSKALHQFHRLDLTRQTRLVSDGSDEQDLVQGTVIAFFSPKGGVGKTMLSANLGVAVAQETGARVALVDVNPQFGHLGLVLNVHSNYNLMDLLIRSNDLEPELVEGMMASHSSGVQVLLAPSEIERVDAFTPLAMSRVLSELRTMFDWTIIDTWSVLGDSTLDVFETADRVLLVVVPDITCLRNTRQFLDLAESLNYPLDKFEVIVNRATEGGLDRKIIEEGLRRQIAMEIPQDDPLVSHSLNRGIPLVISHKRSPVSKAVRQLAEWIVAGSDEPVTRHGVRIRMQRLLDTAGDRLGSLTTSDKSRGAGELGSRGAEENIPPHPRTV